MAVNDMVVRILGDSRSVERAFARSSKAANQFNTNIATTGAKIDSTSKKFSSFAKGTAVGFGGAFAVTEVMTQVRAAIDVASNLQEQISRTNVVFGSSANAIEKWATTTADSIGIANDQALEAAGTFGAMFDQAGVSSTRAATLSKAVVTLASDLASFNNTSVDDSLVALRSGLSGEIEPLRRFQVFLTEAAVSQRAMADSGKTNVKQLTQGEKIMARWALILEQTTKQQGDYARTSDSLANQQRKLAAQTRDLQANVGGLLVPAMKNLTAGMSTATEASGNLLAALKKLGAVQIPKIELPFDVTIGGQSIGDAAGGLFGKVKRTPLNPLFAAQIANDIANQFRDQTEAATPGLSASMNAAVNNMISTALQSSTFGITTLPSFTLPGAETGDAAKRAAEIIDQANGNLQGVLASQIKTRDQLAKNLEVARATFKDQKKINTVAIAYANAQAAVINTQQQIASNTASARDAAKATAAAEAATLDANKKAAADRAARLRLAKQAATQAAQFRALGLAGTGEEIVPGIKNLQTRIAGALRRIGSGELDVSSKLTERLRLARKLIRKDGKNLTDDTRRVINDLINTVTQGQNKLDATTGPLTKTSSLRANQILAGLGLSPDLEKELRARLSSFNSARKALAGAQIGTTGGFRGGIPVTQTNITVEIDGEAVGRATRKSDQKNTRRNPTQKRGSRRGGV